MIWIALAFLAGLAAGFFVTRKESEELVQTVKHALYADSAHAVNPQPSKTSERSANNKKGI